MRRKCERLVRSAATWAGGTRASTTMRAAATATAAGVGRTHAAADSSGWHARSRLAAGCWCGACEGTERRVSQAARSGGGGGTRPARGRPPPPAPCPGGGAAPPPAPPRPAPARLALPAGPFPERPARGYQQRRAAPRFAGTPATGLSLGAVPQQARHYTCLTALFRVFKTPPTQIPTAFLCHRCQYIQHLLQSQSTLS
ncbi:forkhead box protein L2-like [Schistocerca nitens]|uniref:forkhead box protein L2-like n=1 Tax=Schistocerca nitens TaxID=7011 RepID=UPI0021178695|nr:forkhead box protein L2-like [Schistocerca nitens]